MADWEEDRVPLRDLFRSRTTDQQLVLFGQIMQLERMNEHKTDHPSPSTANDDPSRVVTVAASDGKTGNERSISYTNCKVVGNGSFGVVFAAKMLSEKQADGSDSEEQEIAIKKVLQDKRFKVSWRAKFCVDTWR